MEAGLSMLISPGSDTNLALIFKTVCGYMRQKVDVESRKGEVTRYCLYTKKPGQLCTISLATEYTPQEKTSLT